MRFAGHLYCTMNIFCHAGLNLKAKIGKSEQRVVKTTAGKPWGSLTDLWWSTPCRFITSVKKKKKKKVDAEGYFLFLPTEIIPEESEWWKCSAVLQDVSVKLLSDTHYCERNTHFNSFIHLNILITLCEKQLLLSMWTPHLKWNKNKQKKISKRLKS